MGPPSSPLALSAAFLAMLQARHAPATTARAPSEAEPSPAAARPTPAAPPTATGRGRLVDILA